MVCNHHSWIPSCDAMVLLLEILAGHLTHICGSETMGMCVFSMLCFPDILVVIIVPVSQSVSSVAQSYPTLCNPMNCSMPGLPVHHQLLEFTQTQRPSSQWWHPAISSSVVPFSSCPQSLPASQSFPMSQLFSWGGQSTGVSALASFLQYILIGSMLILYYVLFYLDLTMYTRWVEHMSKLLSFGDYFFF